jgi:(1->4)-alpha-D-glucan 1-alpha-D-glucosylmutase
MLKAIREAKSLTSWAEPDTAYERVFAGFMKAILDPAAAPEFHNDFIEFSSKIHRYGVYNSLSQTVLKVASPGVPDFYQGAELWDLNLVDPDNRRPVDFGRREEVLATLTGRMSEGPPGLLRDLLLNPEDGAVKIFLIQRALAARGENMRLFNEGGYVPLYAEGERKQNIICFARKSEDRSALVIAPRFFTSLVEPHDLPIGEAVWKDTWVSLPEGFPVEWRDAITGRAIRAEGCLKIGCVLSDFPVALLIGTGP